MDLAHLHAQMLYPAAVAEHVPALHTTAAGVRTNAAIHASHRRLPDITLYLSTCIYERTSMLIDTWASAVMFLEASGPTNESKHTWTRQAWSPSALCSQWLNYVIFARKKNKKPTSL